MISDLKIAPIVNKVFAVGEKLQLELISYPESESMTLTWTSDTKSVATIDSNGVVTAVAVGETLIKVRDSKSGLTDYANIVVVSVEDYDVILPEVNENMIKGYVKIITAND